MYTPRFTPQALTSPLNPRIKQLYQILIDISPWMSNKYLKMCRFEADLFTPLPAPSTHAAPPPSVPQCSTAGLAADTTSEPGAPPT